MVLCGLKPNQILGLPGSGHSVFQIRQFLFLDEWDTMISFFSLCNSFYN